MKSSVCIAASISFLALSFSAQAESYGNKWYYGGKEYVLALPNQISTDSLDQKALLAKGLEAIHRLQMQQIEKNFGREAQVIFLPPQNTHLSIREIDRWQTQDGKVSSEYSISALGKFAYLINDPPVLRPSIYDIELIWSLKLGIKDAFHSIGEKIRVDLARSSLSGFQACNSRGEWKSLKPRKLPIAKSDLNSWKKIAAGKHQLALVAEFELAGERRQSILLSEGAELDHYLNSRSSFFAWRTLIGKAKPNRCAAEITAPR